MDASLDISPGAPELAMGVAEWIIGALDGKTGRFALNLSGGSTPKRLYQLLATEIYRRRIDWPRVHIFFGDERFVPSNHPDSNFRMAREALLDHVPIPVENIHPVDTSLGSPEQAAESYEATLKRFYGKDTLDMERQLFDVTLLGLGDDGHTASLFPGTKALGEWTRWTCAVVGAKPEPRISMTYPVLQSSSHLAFLVSGEQKKDVLGQLLNGDRSLPATAVRPQGEFKVFCDDAAAPDRPDEGLVR